MTTALVTGGSGFVATRLVPELLDSGYDVVALGRKERPEWMPEPARYERTDLTRGGLRGLFSDVGVVFHLAGLSSSHGDQDAMLSSNVQGTENVMGAAFEAGVDVVLHMSSTSVYGEEKQLEQPVVETVEPSPSRGYGKAKWLAEQVAWRYADKGLAVIVVRPVTVYGPRNVKLLGSSILDAAVENYAGMGALEVWRRPLEMRCVHIDDLVRACMHLLHRPKAVGRAFNVTMPHYPTSVDVAGMIARGFGMELEPVDEVECGLTYEQRKRIHADMVRAGMRDAIMLNEQRFRFLRKENRNNRLSVDALLSTGFEFVHTDLDAGVGATIDWYRAHHWII